MLHSLREGERELAGGGVLFCPPQGKYFILFIYTTTQQQPSKGSRHALSVVDPDPGVQQ